MFKKQYDELHKAANLFIRTMMMNVTSQLTFFDLSLSPEIPVDVPDFIHEDCDREAALYNICRLEHSHRSGEKTITVLGVDFGGNYVVVDIDELDTLATINLADYLHKKYGHLSITKV